MAKRQQTPTQLVKRPPGRPPGAHSGQITPLQAQVVSLRAKGETFRSIATTLGIDLKNCHDSYVAGLKHMGIDVPKKLADDLGVGLNDFRRMEHSQAIEVATRSYWKIVDEAIKGRRVVDRDGDVVTIIDPATAVTALNGLRPWIEMAIKLHGVAAPEQHQHQVTFTPEAIDAEILRLSQVVDSDLDPD